MSPKEDMTHGGKSNPGPGSGSGSGGDGQGDRGKDIVQSPPPPGSPKDRASGKSVDNDGDDDDVVVIVPPPVPAPVPSAGDTGGKQAPGVGGGGGEGTSTVRGKKRGRPPKAKEPVVANQGAVVLAEGERPKKRAEFDGPEVPRPCSVCGKNFNNYKALFGHMRSHPSRLWRGAYPPPISPPSSPSREIQKEGEQLASSLLSIGERLILGDPEEGGDGGAGASGSQPSGAHPRGLDIDLNLDPVLSDPPSPENVEAEKKEIDLNKDPSDEGEGDKW